MLSLLSTRNVTLDMEKLSASLTWLLVAVSALALSYGADAVSHRQWLVAVALYLSFYVTFLAAVRDRPYTHDARTRWILAGVQFGVVCGLFVCLPFAYNVILMVIWSAQIMYLLSFRTAIMLSPLWSMPLWLTLEFYWGQGGAWLTALLFWTFNLFALVMVNAQKRASESNERAQALNRELLATQALLEAAARDSERTRIARNIHDLLGHHLTALTIHLQVVERQLSGDMQQKVAKCQQISRLLLSDVRAAVADMRAEEGLDLHAALTLLTRDLPGLAVALSLNKDAELTVEQADTLLKTVQETLTNIMRHSQATEASVSLEADDTGVQLTVMDNGTLSDVPPAGNGLRGMQERIMALGGTLTLDIRNGGLCTQVVLPREPV
ncbi:sensor histidine kinase [Alteromonas sp. ASW11-19]|uniref:Sensor histidine kinase n=1 Tax=Alteromonas salexigens TaxID=2982530 RepID=A0ABT2VPQ9_9ALTE|nr:sensor histidine kinase [Alteromonas salexigens]MCU7555282.1 sensor histidine kinase [Alteromonas salexigens]